APAKQFQPAPADNFHVDPAKAAKGREFSASLGCAACHTLRIDGFAIATTSAAPLSQLTETRGCLDQQSRNSPRYVLSHRQRSDIASALAAARSGQEKQSDENLVQQTLIRFNCIACHDRNNLGGVIAARDEFFMSDMP